MPTIIGRSRRHLAAIIPVAVCLGAWPVGSPPAADGDLEPGYGTAGIVTLDLANDDDVLVTAALDHNNDLVGVG